MMNPQKLSVVFFLLTSVTVVAQVASPANAGAAVGSSQPTGNAASVSSPVLQSFAQLDQTARQTVVDLRRVRVDKWKADSNSKEQGRTNVESLQKNLSAALPSLMQQVQSNPESLAPALKLYRNLNVVYDVLASVTESTGAFGSKDDYQALASDTSNVDQVRRNIADQLEQMAAAKDSAYAQLAAQLRAQQQQAAAEATPPKKVIVDDNEPPKKPAKKKKSSEKKPAAATAEAAPKPQ
jgi:hypothetical protein